MKERKIKKLKNPFEGHQKKHKAAHEERIDEILVLLGKSKVKFKTLTMLAEHVSGQLTRENMPLTSSALLRNKHIKDGELTPNPYKILLNKYVIGKYFRNGDTREITVEDVDAIRRKNPVVDAYCSLKEGEVKNLEQQVNMLTKEVSRLEGGKALAHPGATSDHSVQLDKTVTALKRLLGAANDFFGIDWERRAIVDLSSRHPKVIVEPELLISFFEALENAGIAPEDV